MDPTVQWLDRALVTTGQIVAGIEPEQWSRPTACVAWDVRQETNHLVGGMRIFTADILGVDAGGGHDSHDWLGENPALAYQHAARADLDAWQRPGALTQIFHLSFGDVPGPMALVIHLTEIIVHGLDLAVATGQEFLIDEGSSERLLAEMQKMGGMDAFRVPGIFGPEKAPPAGALAHHRLLAYLGRDSLGVAGRGAMDVER